MQRINLTKSMTLDAVEKSLALRYAEVLALRKAVRKETSRKKPEASGAKRAQLTGK